MIGFLNRLLGWAGGPRQASCDTCAYVHFFRSNGDGQVPRLNAFCRCPNGPYRDRPIPRARRCDMWQPSTGKTERPEVGDPSLTV